MKKYFLGAAFLLVVLVTPLAPAQAQTATYTPEQIATIITSFLIAITLVDENTITCVGAAIRGTTPPSYCSTPTTRTTTSTAFCHTFNANLSSGMEGPEVTALQTALQKEQVRAGIAVTVQITGQFSYNENDELPFAVRWFQERNFLPQTGFVGPLTRAKLNALYGCSTTQQPAQTTTTPVTPTVIAAPTAVSVPVIIINDDKSTSALSYTVPFGGTVAFTWSVSPTSGTTCVAAGNGLGGTVGYQPTALSGSWTTPALTTSTIYGAKCTNAAGTTYKYVNVVVSGTNPTAILNTTTSTVSAPVIIINNDTNSQLNYTINAGSPITFTWSVTPTSGTTCYAAGNGLGGTTGYQQTALSGTWTTSPTISTIYGAKCTNASGTTYRYVNVVVSPAAGTTPVSTTPAPAPTITSISPSGITAGQAATFLVTGSNLQFGATIYYSIGTSSGSLTPTVNSSTQLMFTAGASGAGTYTFYVKNPDGQTSGSLSVSVTAQPAPIVTLTQGAATSATGDTVYIAWTTENSLTISSCTAKSSTDQSMWSTVTSGGSVGTANFVLNSTGTYYGKVFCTTTSGGTVNSNTIQHTVIAPVTPALPVVTLTQGTNTSASGETVNIAWTVDNPSLISSCTAKSSTDQNTWSTVASYPDGWPHSTSFALPTGTYYGKVFCTTTSGSQVTSNMISHVVSMNTSGSTQMNQTASALNALTNATGATASFSYTWNNNLQIGSPYTDDVRALQTALTREGVYTGEITGGFYNQTFTAVKAFQQKYGIEATGFVGPITREKLNALY